MAKKPYLQILHGLRSSAHLVSLLECLLPFLLGVCETFRLFSGLLARLSQLTHRVSEFSWFDGCKVLVFLHAHPEKGL
jgi:hypothetical protein